MAAVATAAAVVASQAMISGAFSVTRQAVQLGFWPRVQIVLNHVGADGSVVRALLAQGVDGLVVAGTGTGALGQERIFIQRHHHNGDDDDDCNE